MPASARLAPENGPAARSPAHPHLRTTRLLRRLLAPENEPTARSPAHPHLRTTRLLRRLLASEQNDLELCSTNFGNTGLGVDQGSRRMIKRATVERMINLQRTLQRFANHGRRLIIMATVMCLATRWWPRGRSCRAHCDSEDGECATRFKLRLAIQQATLGCRSLGSASLLLVVYWRRPVPVRRPFLVAVR